MTLYIIFSYATEGYHEEAQILWNATHVSAQKVDVGFEEVRPFQIPL